MILENLLIFDQTISGTTETWTTSDSFDRRLGAADVIGLQAVPTDVSGSPTLTVTNTTAFDGRMWRDIISPILNAPLVEDEAMTETAAAAFFVAAASFVRFRIALGGTTPACRLKLYATLRNF